MDHLTFFMVLIPFFVTWIFASLKIAIVSITILIIVFACFWSQKFNYYLKIGFFNFIFMFSTFIYLPFFVIHPFSYDNLGYIIAFWRMSLKVYRVQIETRDIEKSHVNTPAVIVSNHQSSLDLLSLVHVLPPRTTILAKKEIVYLGWFGLCAYLCNIIFVDRSNHNKAIGTMAGVVDIMKKKNVNVLIYPEGTRNMDGSLLPFKKGAFHLAIQAQVPILPYVSSSFSTFLDHKAKRFDTGRIIAQFLEPVETKGLTVDDIDPLIERVRNDMLKVFQQLSSEVMQHYVAYDTNPPKETLSSKED